MRHSAATISLALAACLVFCADGCLDGRTAVAGDDAASETTPAAKAAKVAAAFPEPSTKSAYSFEGDFYVGEQRVGHAKFAAAPSVADGKPAWTAAEEAGMLLDGLRLTYHLVMTLGKDGSVRSAQSSHEQDGQEPRRVTVERTETGLRVSSKTGTADPEVVDLKTDALVFCPFASVLLFLRQAPAEPATYAFETFEPSESALKHGTLEVKGPGTWTKGEKPVETWWAVAHLGDRDMEIHLSPDREILALATPSIGLVVAKAGLVKTAARAALKPAASAKEAVVRYTIGSSTGDLDMVSVSLHFPTLYADAKKLGALMSESDFRADVIARLKSGKKRVRLEDVEPIVNAAVDEAVETREGDVVKIVLGASLQGIEFFAKQFDDGWYLVKMPGW